MSVADVCAVCARVLEAGGVGVSLLHGGRLEPVHARGDLGRQLLEAELTSGDGPCVEAALTGGPVLAADLGDAEAGRRWPLFTATAHTGRVAAAFAFPLLTPTAKLGVLVACRERPGGLDSAQYRDALLLADAAVTLLLSDQLPIRDPSHAPSLDRSLDRSGDGSGEMVMSADWLALGAEVHQAAGMVSVQLDCTVEQALARLRAHAFAHDVPVTQVAARVVARTLRFSPDPTPRQ
ncbi:ANTAR domain-containing protein [Spirillospora sp. NPDC127200]